MQVSLLRYAAVGMTDLEPGINFWVGRAGAISTSIDRHAATLFELSFFS
jgi:hypothetical protein